MKDISVTVKLPDEQVVALNRAADQMNKVATTAPNSWLRAARAGMTFQRALSALARFGGSGGSVA